MTFDSSVLRALGARTGALTPGWSIAANTNTTGQIRLSMASSGGTSSGTGPLALIEFEVLGAPGASSALRLASVSLNDGAIRVQPADGTFTVSLVYDVSGTVRFWNGSAAVSNVVFSLRGDRVYSGQSGSNGVYRVSGADTGNYTLTPVKSDEVKAITAYDASLALQHDAGLITLTGSAAVAADVNKSGTITSFDAFLILQKAVDLISVPFTGAGVVWDFSPATRSYSNLNSHQTSQDFTAILLGDISGNWSQPTLQSVQATAEPSAPAGNAMAVIGLRRQVVLDSNQSRAWLLLKASKSSVYSIDVTLEYNPSPGAPPSIQVGTLAKAFVVASRIERPGTLRVAFAGAVPIQGPGGLLIVNLEGIAAPRLKIANVSVNEGTLTTRIDATASIFDEDSDGDGQSDWDEIRADTDPTSPTSFLGITRARVNRDGTMTISWSSVEGKTYRLLRARSVPALNWQELPGDIFATGTSASKVVNLPDLVATSFYRLKLIE